MTDHVSDNLDVYFGCGEHSSVVLEPHRLAQVQAWLTRAQQESHLCRVLDVGCWSGTLDRLAPVDVECFGVDQRRHAELAPRVRFVAANVEEKLPFEDGFFDLVFAGEIIEHLLDTRRFLRDIHRVLTLSGWLILTTPNLSCWLSGWRWLTKGQPWCVDSEAGQCGHVRYLAPHSLRDLLNAEGFDIASLTTGGGLEFLHRVPGAYSLAHKLFPMRGKNLMALCRKGNPRVRP